MTAHDWGLRFQPTPGPGRVGVPARQGGRRLVGGEHVHRAPRASPTTTTSGPRCGLPEWSWERCLPGVPPARGRPRHRGRAPPPGRPAPHPPPPARRAPRPGRPRSTTPAPSSASRAAPTTTGPRRLGFGPHPMNKIDRRAHERGALLARPRGAPPRRTCASARARSCGACSSRTGARSASRSRPTGRVEAIRGDRVRARGGRDHDARHPAALGDRPARRRRAPRRDPRRRRPRGGRAPARPPGRRHHPRRAPLPAAPGRARCSRRCSATPRRGARSPATCSSSRGRSSRSPP